MGCEAGYPTEPCPFGKAEGRVTRASCGSCKFFKPPRHILKWCMLWDRDKVLCMKPMAACASCHEKNVRGPGRPAGEGYDRNDRKSVRKYEENYRLTNADKLVEKRERFKKKNPTYWRDYMRARRARGSDEQGGSKV